MQTDSLKIGYSLPQIPNKIYDNNKCSYLLTDRNKNDWKFLFEEIKGIPTAFETNQDYDFNTVEKGKWQDIVVPSSLVFQGFNIENNTEYYYKREVKIPNEFENNQIFIRFEGVYSNARIWVNGKFVASHIGGFTPFDVDITEFADCKKITLVVGVTDVEGDKKGVWTACGEYDSNSAWASYYAHHNIGGILRDITLFALPESAIIQTHIDTFLNGSTSTAKVNCTVTDSCIGLMLNAKIFDGKKSVAEKQFEIKANNFDISLDVIFAERWSAEKPNLYTLNLTLFDDKIIQQNEMRFGFREIAYGGKNGTDKNKVYINGNEIKLRGVCRHDVSQLYGRSVTKEDIYNEIKTYKEHNINHIRTSHYPVSEYMLSVCDELGMYVEQENSACFKGANGFEVYNKSEDFLRSFAEMVELSRNHPSVIVWSIANESGFEKSMGFRDCYNYIKKTDLTRPVIFSYPFTVKSKPLPYDIFSKHYAKVNLNLGKKDMPILHDEFAHVPCYNIDDLMYDNSTRVIWGQSIKKGWDKIFNTAGALGCDIWAAVDDVFYLDDKSFEKHQTHLKGSVSGYGEWGCVFDAFKRLKPEAYYTKKAFSPVHIENTDLYGDEIRFTVQNRFDHTNLNEGEIKITVDNKIIYKSKIKENIEPHKFGTIRIVPISMCDNMTVNFVYNDIEVQSVTVNPKLENLSVKPCGFNVKLNENNISVTVNNETVAVVDSLLLDGKKYQLQKINSNTYKSKHCLIVVNDDLSFEVKPNTVARLSSANSIAIGIYLTDKAESVSWNRNSLYDYYPSNHIGRLNGTAKRMGVFHKYTDENLANVPWSSDMSAFAYFSKNRLENSLASNDFRTKRLNIENYKVSLSNGLSLLIQTSDKHINAYASPFDSTLYIEKCSCFPSIAWGNYFGKITKNKNFKFKLLIGEA
ncbi:MAG: glycoside hydrolase family 2 TIM barrel-domain containing protein [Clostridia bacterium]|nr:glycoside hydrolase family 2 TIM barrel-domain containing protein [Clostridia bacterium]